MLKSVNPDKALLLKEAIVGFIKQNEKQIIELKEEVVNPNPVLT